MAQPRVRTPLVADRIIKSLSLAPYFSGKKIATLGPSAGGGHLVDPSSVASHPPTGYLSILPPGRKIRQSPDYRGEKSARVECGVGEER